MQVLFHPLRRLNAIATERADVISPVGFQGTDFSSAGVFVHPFKGHPDSDQTPVLSGKGAEAFPVDRELIFDLFFRMKLVAPRWTVRTF